MQVRRGVIDSRPLLFADVMTFAGLSLNDPGFHSWVASFAVGAHRSPASARLQLRFSAKLTTRTTTVPWDLTVEIGKPHRLR
jgi:hypothetical protein